MKIEKDIYITMRDGVRIACCIYRPETNGKFPALLAASPYQYEYDSVPSHFYMWHELGPIEFYVERGYVYVHVDVRGSGRSEGTWKFMDTDEQKDLYEIIEWIGTRQWCNGRVGGIGQSYYAMLQWFMGIQNPPHLACLAPYDGLVDPYRDSVYNGGVYGPFFANWHNRTRADNIHRPANVPSENTFPYDLTGEIIRRTTYDDWWRERCAMEHLNEIKCPVLSIGVWPKLGLHLRGNILGYEMMQGPKNLLLVGAKNSHQAHLQYNTREFHEKHILPFYDHYLKGEDNGWQSLKPVNIFVRGDEQFREENEWPLQQARTSSYYLHAGPSGSVNSLNDGGLSPDSPDEPKGDVTYSYPDPHWENGVMSYGEYGPDHVAHILTFTSAPLERDLEVTGPIILELFASSDQPDTDFVVKVSEQLPESVTTEGDRPPPFKVVSKGWLKASHRVKDNERSTKWRPFYAHRDPQPLTIGEIYKFEIEILPCAYVFKAQSRVRLEIANGDSPLTESPRFHHYHPAKHGSDTIYFNVNYPSRLLLPVVSR